MPNPLENLNNHCCGNCMFFRKIGLDPNQGECRRFPPYASVLPAGMIQGPAGIQGRAMQKNTYWPNVSPKDWGCGEYQPFKAVELEDGESLPESLGEG